MTLAHLWHRFRIWLLSRLYTLAKIIAQWCESQLASLSPAISQPEPESERLPGQPPKHWLDKVQAAAQPPDHWLDYIHDKLGHMPNMQDMSAMTRPESAAPESKTKTYPPQKQPTTPNPDYQSPRTKNTPGNTQYTTRKSTTVPDHLRWRIQPKHKSSTYPPAYNTGEKQVGQSQSPEYIPLGNDDAQRDARYASKQNRVPPADTSYQNAPQTRQPSTTNYTPPYQQTLGDAQYSPLPNTTDRPVQYPEAHQSRSGNSDYREDVPSASPPAETRYQVSHSSQQTESQYPLHEASSNHLSPERDSHYQTPESPTEAEAQYQVASRNPSQSNSAYQAPASSDFIQPDYQSPSDAQRDPIDNSATRHIKKARPSAENAPDRLAPKQHKTNQPRYAEWEQSSDSGLTSYQQPQQTSHNNVSYSEHESGADHTPVYQSPQPSQIPETRYKPIQSAHDYTPQYPSRRRQSVRESRFVEPITSRGGENRYQSGTASESARELLQKVTEDYWVPLPSERTVTSPPALQRPNRIDAEQKGEM